MWSWSEKRWKTGARWRQNVTYGYGSSRRDEIYARKFVGSLTWMYIRKSIAIVAWVAITGWDPMWKVSKNDFKTSLKRKLHIWASIFKSYRDLYELLGGNLDLGRYSERRSYSRIGCYNCMRSSLPRLFPFCVGEKKKKFFFFFMKK